MAGALLAPVALVQGASAADRPAVAATGAADKAQVDKLVRSILLNPKQIDTLTADLTPAQSKAVGEALADQVAEGARTMEWDTSGIAAAQQKVALSAKRICVWGRAEGHKNIAFFEMSGFLYVRVCGTGRVKTGLTTEVNNIQSGITITWPGVYETYKGSHYRIYDNQTRARALARWEIAVIYKGLPFRRTICPQMQLTGWHPPLALGNAGVEHFWPDYCQLL